MDESPRKPRKKKAPKATAKQAIDRLTIVIEMMTNAYSHRDIVRYGKENWNLSARTVYEIIEDAREYFRVNLQNTAQDAKAEMIETLRRIVNKTLGKEDYRVAVAAIREKSELLGLKSTNVNLSGAVSFEKQVEAMTDEELRAKTKEIADRLARPRTAGSGDGAPAKQPGGGK